MAAHLIDGKKIASELRAQIASRVDALKSDHNLTPGLAVVLVGEDPASQVYVRNKGIATKEVGMNSLEFRLPADTSQDALLYEVRALNEDAAVHGILVQFPVPAQISQQAVIDTISPQKDVDGLHPVNAGRLASGHFTGPGAALAPCTPQGSVLLARAALGDLTGAHAVVVGGRIWSASRSRNYCLAKIARSASPIRARTTCRTCAGMPIFSSPLSALPKWSGAIGSSRVRAS